MIYNGEARLRVPSGGLRLAVAEPNSRAKLAYALQNRASARRRRRRQDSNLHGISATAFRERPFDQIQALLLTFQTIIFLIEFQYENCHHWGWGKDGNNVCF